MLKILILVAILGAVSGFPIKQDSLNNIYKKFIPTVDSFVKNVNVDCVESKLNLPKNGHKVVKGEQGFMLVMFAAYLCSEELRKPRINQKLTKLRQLITLLEPETVKCMKISLWELEPNSPLLDSINKNVIADDISSCKNSKEFKEFSDLMDQMWVMAEQLLGTEIKKCRNPEAEKKNMYTMMALVDETRPAVKSAEIGKYIKAETTLQDTFFNCVMVPIENMEVANVIDEDEQEKD